jgi:hypothetical protein
MCGLYLAAWTTGCERAPAPPPDQAPAVAEETAVAARWELQTSEDEASLSVIGADASVLFRIACVRPPARMQITVPGFAVIESEERLTLGVDDEAFTFVAEVVGRPPRGVRAESPMQAELLDRFARTRDVAAVYGAETAGPYLSPPPHQSEAFVAACRAIAG